MSLTDSQKVKVRTYLGFPSVYLTSNPRLEGFLNTVGLDGYVVLEIEQILSDLADVEVRLRTTGLDVAGISSAGTGDPEFYKGQTQKDIRNEGRRLVSKLSSLIGMPIMNDVFGNAGMQQSNLYSNEFQYGFAKGFFF